MKPQLNHLLLALALTQGAAAQSPTNFLYGADFGSSGQNGNLIPWSWGSEKSLQLAAFDGSLLLYSSQEGLTRGSFDGGVVTYGNPIDMVLGSDESPQIDRGAFRVWGSSTYLYGSSTATPLFSIEHPAGTATFDGLDVTISNGTLTVAGSPALTQASSTSYLNGQGFIQSSGLATALSGITPPTSTSWTNTYLARGNVTNSGALALGTSTSASAQYAVAIGHGATASGTNALSVGNGASSQGTYSFSMGISANAVADHSFAFGNGVTANSLHTRATGASSSATGFYATAHGNVAVSKAMYANATGFNSTANTADETVFGRYNVESTFTNAFAYNGQDGLFRLGNGTNTARSDAMSVLKNGQTTLTNKEWKAAVTADPTKYLDDPASTTDSGGNALVVDGHTRLKGKVLIQPQGDLSMGGFTGGETP